MLTTHEAADRLGIKPRSVVQLIKRDLLAAVKHGRDYSIDPAEVERYITERRPPHRPKSYSSVGAAESRMPSAPDAANPQTVI